MAPTSVYTDKELREAIAAKMRTEKGCAEARDILATLFRWYEEDDPAPLSLRLGKARPAIPMSERILVSEPIAAELCGVSLKTFRDWMKGGLIRPVDLPGNLRRNLYRRADIEAFAGGRSSGA
jgi:hypothetical protein